MSLSPFLERQRDHRQSSTPLPFDAIADYAGPVLRRVLLAEEETLRGVRVAESLSRLLESPPLLRSFGVAFYFIRYDFYRQNFIVGSRCGPDEKYWSGLVLNLLEELGGLEGTSHNQLYRDFLADIGVEAEPTDGEPSFATTFNSRWEDHCRAAPLVQSLAAIAVYEILDRPDYALLLEVMRQCGVTPRGLKFFAVHADARHFDFFEDLVTDLSTTKEGREAVERAIEFVLATQKGMWQDLIRYLESIPA